MNEWWAAVIIAVITAVQTLVQSFIIRRQLQHRPPVGGRCMHCGRAHSDPPQPLLNGDNHDGRN